ncbi:putative non-specific protein-tyrosine kinase RLK-Pelle-RLCK-XV family [Dioscorea sansibarensis]
MLKCFCCRCGESRTSQRCFNKSHSHPWETYTLKELLHATNNFHDENKLGEGGFGTVYWGRNNKGIEIAVKRLKSMTAKAEMEFAVEVEILGRVRHKNLLTLRGFYAGDAKAEMEFAVEVEILGRVRHKNLLTLRGFYAGGDERLIVYDYMPNHSLVTHLHGKLASEVKLDWHRRMSVAIGAAEGLLYLHNEVSPHIIHRDIKASNVLLDSDFNAKVADFGFAKLVPDGMTHVTTKVKGTLGYLAPEYAMWGKASNSCDVYSFGILLLELVTGRKPIEKLPGGIKRDIVHWVTPMIENGRWTNIVDPRLGGKYDLMQLRNTVVLAIRCTNGESENRPTMTEVVEYFRGGILGDVRKKEVVVMKNGLDDHEDYEDDYDTGVSHTPDQQCAKSSYKLSR